MARPVEVADEEIIEAGRRLEAEGARVSGWTLHRALGGRGRPNRMMAVWAQSREAAASLATTADGGEALLPPRVLELCADLKAATAAKLDELTLSIFRVVEETLAARYQAEMAELRDMRARYVAEMAEAEEELLAAAEREIGLRERIALLEADLAVAATDRVRMEERLLAGEDRLQAERRVLEEKEQRLQAAVERAAAAELAATVQRGNAERAQKEGAELRQQFQRAERELADLTAKVTYLDRSLQTERDRADGLASDVAREREDRRAAEATVAAATERAIAAESRLGVFLEGDGATPGRKGRKRERPSMIESDGPLGPSAAGQASGP